MAREDDLKKFIGSIGQNPQLIQELISTQDPNARKAALTKHGFVAPNAHGFSQDEMKQEITKLLYASGVQAPAPGERAVEWVAAIGTAAAGAAAGACTAD